MSILSRKADGDKSDSEDEVFARHAAEAAERLVREREAVERAHRDAMQPIREKLQKARKLINESGVGDAACTTLRVMWHWSSWSKRADWSPPLLVENLDGGERPSSKDGRPIKWLEWTLAGTQFRLEHEASQSIGHLRLHVSGEEVLELEVSQKPEDEYDRWVVFGVSAFRAGPWMTQLNEWAGKLRIVDGQFMREYDLQYYKNIASKIEL
jgi:hypothetical protein